MKYSVAITEKLNEILIEHLLRDDLQEDLCFALYSPSSGEDRESGLIKEIILPSKGDRNVHGNVSFNSRYFDKVCEKALKLQLGICFIHSHPSKGWQGMSKDDIDAEEMLAPRVKAVTGLPSIGMTLSLDEVWSARFWIKDAPKKYSKHSAGTVRVIGKGICMSYYDKIIPHPNFGEEFLRTISSWGDKKQGDLSRLKVGIVGLGSVGSVIAEALIKTGLQNLVLIDFDTVERKNLDRLQGIGPSSVGYLKVFAIRDYLKTIQVGEDVTISAIPYSIIEEQGYKKALDCDILFSCVDRPWPRFVLNCISYCHLIPVIDGGIDTNPNKRGLNLDQARWKTHTVGPGRICLCCLGQYKPEDVALEQSGLLEDQTYIKTLPKEHFINRGENVFAFSLGLAAMEVQQFLSLVLQPRGQYYGPKEFDFNSGNIDSNFNFVCDDGCDFTSMSGMGNVVNAGLITSHPIAERKRNSANKLIIITPTLTLALVSAISNIIKSGKNRWRLFISKYKFAPE